ncbi:uncharacterized protein DUF445 [Hydrogenispora ethanolica]|uniref:Uncharacterized protein DUF445 n=1 Tax=Hydrogenispora ethanolica TaxID=1082276 RepID=A0A4R1QXF1_HYDET|nr:DUF445 family protein [Hydrogenispora ethanolica]TCL55590.1 uncharacterized protein DUF445 [Hydrogenispora ethanolica]
MDERGLSKWQENKDHRGEAEDNGRAGGSGASRGFCHKWLGRLAEELRRSGEPGRETAAGHQCPAHWDTFSLKFAKVLNSLNRPFFGLGIAFITWLIVEVILERWLPAGDFQRLSAAVRPYTKYIGPTVVGYWTNWLAIKMLFYPRRPNRLWQGLIPARRNELIRNLAAGIHERLFSAGIVREYLQKSPLLQELACATGRVVGDSEFRDELRELCRRYLKELVQREETRQVVRRVIGEIIESWEARTLLEKPAELTKRVWGPWVQERVVDALPSLPYAMADVLSEYEQWLDELPAAIARNQGNIEAAVTSVIEQGLELLDVPGILHCQLAKLDEQELEQALTGNVMTELEFIQTSGGLFGFLVALALECPPARLPMLAVGFGLWLLYRRTVR